VQKTNQTQPVNLIVLAYYRLAVEPLTMVRREPLVPPLPLAPPWRCCLYCQHFELWEGSLPFCCKHKAVLSLRHALERRCSFWQPGGAALLGRQGYRVAEQPPLEP
jgi:hypothetical protein